MNNEWRYNSSRNNSHNYSDAARFLPHFFKKNYGENVNVSATLYCQMFNYLGDNYGSAGFFFK